MHKVFFQLHGIFGKCTRFRGMRGVRRQKYAARKQNTWRGMEICGVLSKVCGAELKIAVTGALPHLLFSCFSVILKYENFRKDGAPRIPMPNNQLITNQNKFLREVINKKQGQRLIMLEQGERQAGSLKRFEGFREGGDNREKERLNEAISQLDQRIDRMVYGLYGLTEEKIAIVVREIGGK